MLLDAEMRRIHGNKRIFVSKRWGECGKAEL